MMWKTGWVESLCIMVEYTRMKPIFRTSRGEFHLNCRGDQGTVRQSPGGRSAV